MAGPRRLHLVRHGETEGQSSIRFWGRTDVALSAAGRAEVAGLLPFLAGGRITRVWHSPLLRAVESARVLVAGLAPPPAAVEACAAFTELDFGAAEGLTRAEIVARFPDFAAAWARDAADRFPDGELLAAFRDRVRDGFVRCRAALDAAGPGDVLIVAHRGVIRRIAEHLLGPGDHGTALASLSTIELADPPQVVRWNLQAPPAPAPPETPDRGGPEPGTA